MADAKISQLTSATTPLAGTEELPIVQSGTTKKVAAANIVDGRTIAPSAIQGNIGLKDSGGTQKAMIAPSLGGSFRIQGQSAEPITMWVNNVQKTTLDTAGDFTLIAGNLKVASGKGIDFSATSQAAGMTSELLDDYEEGIWTPDFYTTATDIVPTSVYGRYTKVGNLVTAVATLTMPASYVANYEQVRITLPLVSANTQEAGGGFVTKTTATQVAYTPCRIPQNSLLAYFQTINAGAWGNLEYNGRTPQLGAGNTLTVFFNYFVD